MQFFGAGEGDYADEAREKVRRQGFSCMAKVIRAAMAADHVAENPLATSVWAEAVAEPLHCTVHSAGCYGNDHYTEAGADLMRQLARGVPLRVDNGKDYYVEWLPIGKVLVPRFRFKEPQVA